MGSVDTKSPKQYFIDELTNSFHHFGDKVDGGHPRTLHKSHVIEYISDAFSNFIKFGFKPDIERDMLA